VVTLFSKFCGEIDHFGNLDTCKGIMLKEFIWLKSVRCNVIVNRVLELWEPQKAESFVTERLFAFPGGFCSEISVQCTVKCVVYSTVCSVQYNRLFVFLIFSVGLQFTSATQISIS
jgi:hypothetical protein